MTEPHEQMAWLTLGPSGPANNEDHDKGVAFDESPLFQLPAEILAEIPGYLSSDSLASLALVSHDCRQLALSCQFANFTLDYKPGSLRLLEKLFAEHKERLGHNGLMTPPSLGACIRSITVPAEWQRHVSHHDLKDKMVFGENDKELLDQELEEDAYDYDGDLKEYIQVLMSMIFNRATLPNLKLFDWVDRLSVPRSYFNALACSSIRHLRLDGVQIREGFRINKVLKANRWPLKSLYLNIVPANFVPAGVVNWFKVLPLCCSILRLCASTLESFTWVLENNAHDGAYDYHDYDARDLQLPPFTKIRELKLDMVNGLYHPVLDALLQDGLRALEMVNHLMQTPTDFFQRRGKIHSLETFIWDHHTSKAHGFCEFLKVNVQVSKVMLYNSHLQLTEESLPLFSSPNSQLKSLCLAFRCTAEISKRELELIGSMTSLEQFHLLSSESYRRKDDWRDHHKRIRKHLRKLNCLRRLAFSDSRNYIRVCSPGRRDSQRYDPCLRPQGSSNWSLEQKKQLEETHYNDMMEEARKYVDVMPNLEWLYMGRLQMGVQEVQGGGKVFVPLSGRDDDSRDMVDDMFGWKPFFPRQRANDISLT